MFVHDINVDIADFKAGLGAMLVCTFQIRVAIILEYGDDGHLCCNAQSALTA